MTSTVVLALAIFGACAVEAVEAFTIVLASGTTRGWRSALEGAAVALATLVVLVAAVGVPLVEYVPINALRIVIGGLLLVLGLSWLRKAVLRASGNRALHDEDAIYAETVAGLRGKSSPGNAHRDPVGFAVAFKGVFLEGIEVVLIVLSLGTSSHHLALAALSAAAAVLLVIAVGTVVSRQLREVPENALKFGVGVMLSSFGVFWIGEGADLAWPGEDAFILALIAIFAAVSFGLTAALRVPSPLESGRPGARRVS